MLEGEGMSDIGSNSLRKEFGGNLIKAAELFSVRLFSFSLDKIC